MSSWRWSVATFTIIPVGRFIPPTRGTGSMVLLAPLAVLPIALVAAALAALAQWTQPSLLIAVAVVGWLAAATRAMHLDALADVTDALGGGWTPERAREILHRGDVGPMGVVALILILGAQVVAVSELATRPYGWLFVGAAVVASRAAVTLACRRGTRAMPGSRLGAAVAGAVRPAALFASLAVATAVVTLAAWPGPSAPWLVALVAVAAWAVAALLVQQADTRFGGVNGDVMGSTIETALTVLLVGAALLPA